MSTYVLVSKEACDVVTLTEAKSFLRVSFTNDDVLIGFLIKAAVSAAEKYMVRDILTTTWENYRTLNWQDMTLRRGKFQSVTKIEILVDDVYEVLDVANYKTSIGGIFGIICEIDTGNADINCNRSIKITFKTGFGDDADSIPDDIKLAIMNHVNFMYVNRGECNENQMDIPVISKTIYNNYKVVDLGFYELESC